MARLSPFIHDFHNPMAVIVKTKPMNALEWDALARIGGSAAGAAESVEWTTGKAVAAAGRGVTQGVLGGAWYAGGAYGRFGGA